MGEWFVSDSRIEWKYAYFCDLPEPLFSVEIAFFDKVGPDAMIFCSSWILRDGEKDNEMRQVIKILNLQLLIAIPKQAAELYGPEIQRSQEY